MRQRGSGLLDAVAATAVAMTLGAASADLVGASRALSAVTSHERALTVARNVLESAVAAPCGPAPGCAPGLTCDITTEPLGPPFGDAVRVTVQIAFEDGSVSPIRMASARQGSCG